MFKEQSAITSSITVSCSFILGSTKIICSSVKPDKKGPII